jgi:hypothetical protein
VVHVIRYIEGLHLHAQGVWTDGRRAISLGLDQRLRAWRLSTAGSDADMHTGNAADEIMSALSARDFSTAVVQVVEPEALSVAGDDVHGWRVAVAGRGCQVLHLRL